MANHENKCRSLYSADCGISSEESVTMLRFIIESLPPSDEEGTIEFVRVRGEKNFDVHLCFCLNEEFKINLKKNEI